MKKFYTLMLCIFFITGNYLHATKFYVDLLNGNDANSGADWNNSRLTLASAATLGANWDSILVKGNTWSTNATFAFPASRKYFGSCVGSEIFPSQRPLSDIDGNGIIEPWEFTNATILSSTFTGDAFTYPNSGITVDGFTFTQTQNALTIGKRTLTLGYATNYLVNSTIKNCSLTQAMTGSTFSLLFKSLGIVNNCLIEKNNLTVNATNNGTLTPTVSIEGGRMYNCVIRNNYIALNYNSVTTSNARGLILHVAGTTTPGAVVYNSLIYNNEMLYTPSGTADASMSNGCAVDVYSSTTANTFDSLYNCTIANNKGTLVSVAGLKVLFATSAVGVHVVQNNICWNNLKGGVASDVAISSTPTTGTSIANNYTKGTTFTNNGITIVGNSQSTTPNFKSTSTGVGNDVSVTDGSILTSSWKLTTGSDLIGKGVTIPGTGRTTDKTGNTFASSRAIGAYEFYGYSFRSGSTGNWGNTSTWQISSDNSNWNSSTIIPNSEAASIIIQNGHTITIAANATASSLSVNPGANLTLNSGNSLNVNSNLTINSNATNGTGTYVDRGTTTVNGKTTVHQFLSSSATGLTGRNWYISSPLSAASSNTITTATGNGLVKYNNGWENAGTTMDVMTGYIAKSPAQNTTISFSGGTLNTGNKLISNLPLGYNLVGNPYPSYVNWTDAIKTNISTSIWYRSKSTGSYLFQTYNVAGDGVSVNGGTDIIPPMQSFWIKTTNATNSLGFTNNMRSHQDQSIVSNRLKAPKVSNQQLLRLEVSNGIFRDEAVIYFNENAQNTLDDYDSQKMFNNITEVPEIYTQIGVDNLVINGMNKIPYDTEIPLGFSTLQSNNFTISATEIKNFEAGTHIILKDKLNPDSEIELNNATIYDFYSEASNRIDRFSLIFRTPGTTTRLKNTSKLNVQVFVNRENQIMIIAPEKCKFTIYNSVGQIVNNGITSTNCTTINLKLLKGMYVLRLQDKGKELITKVIIK